MTNPLTPNYVSGVGRLTTDRFDFQSHVDGAAFRHQADQIDLNPTISIQNFNSPNVQDAIQRLANIVGSIPIPDATTSSKGVIQLAGDIAGVAANVKVTGLQGFSVSSGAPSTNQVLTWTGSVWAPQTPSATTVVTMSGDVTGNSNGSTVIKLQGRNVSNASPSTNQVLAWNGSTWIPTSVATSVTMGGDVSGNSFSATVVKINGVSVPANPSSGQVLTATSNTSAIWQAPSGGGGGITTLTGDVSASGSGTVAATVIKINGTSIPASPSTGQILTATSGTSATWQVPSITMSGDVVGNSSSTTVAKINGITVPSSPVFGQVLTATSTTTSAWQTPSVTMGGDVSGNSSNATVLKINGTSVPSGPTSGLVLTSTSGTSATWQVPPTGPTYYAFGNFQDISAGSITEIGGIAVTAPTAGFWIIQANFTIGNASGTNLQAIVGIGINTMTAFTSSTNSVTLVATETPRFFAQASVSYRVATAGGSTNIFWLAQNVATFGGTSPMIAGSIFSSGDCTISFSRS